MTGSGVTIIFLWFGVAALLFAAIPGLTLGFLLGLFVKRRDLSYLVCFAISAIGAFITFRWKQPNGPNAFGPITLFVSIGALMIMSSIGAWLGRKLAATAPKAQ
jgi:hypothetical protein